MRQVIVQTFLAVLEENNTPVSMASSPFAARLALTETLAPCIIMSIWGEHRRGSVGWPNPGMEVKIVDDSRNEVPVGETGEIVIKGEPGISLFREYYNNPEATTQDLVDGWFYSGDYGKVDEDGYVYFIDRKKDVIQRAAENISAPEVERVLNDHSAVEESCVIAVRILSGMKR